eukprot:gene2715-3140_t
MQEIGEFKAGLSSLGFVGYMMHYPDSLRNLFCAEHQEEASLMFGPEEFKSYLRKCTPKNFSQRQALDWFSEYIEKEADSLYADSKVNTLLVFITGWRLSPIGGLRSSIQIQFQPDHDAHSLPTSFACLSIIRLPTAFVKEKNF